MTTLKACTVCGRTTTHGPRCPTHALPPRDHHYRLTARIVANSANTCALCGGPPTTTDPFTADHIVPRAHGGPDTLDNLRCVHRSCNSRRGAGTPPKKNNDTNHPAKFPRENLSPDLKTVPFV
jgi:5-methylcytosine-specific restriction endonuclease McrA